MIQFDICWQIPWELIELPSIQAYLGSQHKTYKLAALRNKQELSVLQTAKYMLMNWEIISFFVKECTHYILFDNS